MTDILVIELTRNDTTQENPKMVYRVRAETTGVLTVLDRQAVCYIAKLLAEGESKA